jgi:hypothetical protein
MSIVGYFMIGASIVGLAYAVMRFAVSMMKGERKV